MADLSVRYVPTRPPGGLRVRNRLASPQLSADVAFHSPALTATATCGELVSVILKAVGEISGAPRFRVVSKFREAYVAGVRCHGARSHLGSSLVWHGPRRRREIADMRLYSRPWPVTAFFRGEAYKLIRDQFGPNRPAGTETCWSHWVKPDTGRQPRPGHRRPVVMVAVSAVCPMQK